MKNYFLSLSIFILFLTACSAEVSPPVAVPTESSTVSMEVNSTETNQPDSLLETISTKPDATQTLEVSPTSTPIPEANRWHWVFKPDSSEILVVNQSGEVNSIGEFDLLVDNYDYRLLTVSDHQVLLFTFSQNKPVLFLLNLKEIQEINLPASFYYDANMLINSVEMVGVSENIAYFIFSTEQSYETTGSSYPEKGPIYKIDLVSTEVSLVDEMVYHEPLYDNRLLFLQSKDGLFTRYFSANNNELLVRELNLNTGGVRTITSSTGSPSGVFSSTSGDIFLLTRSNVVIDVEGKSVAITNSESGLRLLRNGEAVISPGNCQGPCDIEIFGPMENTILNNYTLPWVVRSFNRLGTQFLPSQNLLWVGAASGFLLEPPATHGDFPELDEFDSPVFLLSDEKPAELVGIYPYEFSNFFHYPISEDGRYILLKSLTGTHYFMYDAFDNLELFTLPIKEGWDYFYGDVRFYEEGILVHFLASNSDQEYADFYSLHEYGKTGSVYWEDQEGSILSCPNLFSDGTLACWFQGPDLSYDLVRFNPNDQTKESLIENIDVLESTY
ncbi:MAG: hypothetical protein Q7U53_01015 [Anaerolineaceae bacterium]|nr:hypothetical protein [Anaerolineaceae bacterium]